MIIKTLRFGIYLAFALLISACASSPKQDDENIGTLNISFTMNDLYLQGVPGNPFFFTDMAEKKCLSKGEEADFPRCMELLRFRPNADTQNSPVYKEQHNRRLKIFNALLIRGLTEGELDQFEKLVRHLYGPTEFEPQVKVVSSGQYTSTTSDSFIASDHRVILRKGMKFGAAIMFSSNDPKLNKQQHKTAAVFIRWKLPGLRYGEAPPIYRDEYMETTGLDSINTFVFSLDYEGELVEGDWALEIRSLRGKILYQTKFTTIKAISA